MNNADEALRDRLGRFLWSPSPWRSAIRQVSRIAQANCWSAYLFGGTIRDVMARSPMEPPRDLDIVIEGAHPEDLLVAFAEVLVRTNRFGGLHLRIGKVPVDVWSLDQTWAFSERLVADVSLAGLPRTTFLNVEAVAAELTTRPGRRRAVSSYRFFEGISSRQLELNLEENPFPALCVIRTIVTAQKLRYGIGPRLANYISHYSRTLELEEFEEAQRSHYGRLVFERETLVRVLRSLSRRPAQLTFDGFQLPLPRQLRLPGKGY